MRLTRCVLLLAVAVGLTAVGGVDSSTNRAAAKTLIPACAAPKPGEWACSAIIHPNAAAGTGPVGHTPWSIRNAYRLPARGGTVAIVAAYDNPRAEADLAVYRAYFKLPACTTANHCFLKLSQTGVAGNYPPPDTGWAAEISLDLDAVTATCPLCKIILVEANSPASTNLSAAVDTAARFHPGAIGNSYGGPEASTERAIDAHYYHPGIAITVATGDRGYGVEYPAASPWVTAVGGTSLIRNTAVTRGWSEFAWSGGGSGCSKYENKPSWQVDQGCARRTVSDVAAVADPASGLAVYDTYGQDGWVQVGGTSLSAQVVAAIYAMAANAASFTGAHLAYARPTGLFDLIYGANGRCGTGLLGVGPNTYLCQAYRGFDGPTGLGTPNGISAF